MAQSVEKIWVQSQNTNVVKPEKSHGSKLQPPISRKFQSELLYLWVQVKTCVEAREETSRLASHLSPMLYSWWCKPHVRPGKPSFQTVPRCLVAIPSGAVSPSATGEKCLMSQVFSVVPSFLFLLGWWGYSDKTNLKERLTVQVMVHHSRGCTVSRASWSRSHCHVELRNGKG